MEKWEIIAAAKGDLQDTVTTTLPQNDPGTVVTNVMNVAYGIAGVVAVGFIIWAGVTYITSNGDPGKTKQALRTLIYSLVGLAIVLAAAFITNFVFGSVNV